MNLVSSTPTSPVTASAAATMTEITRGIGSLAVPTAPDVQPTQVLPRPPGFPAPPTGYASPGEAYVPMATMVPPPPMLPTAHAAAKIPLAEPARGIPYVREHSRSRWNGGQKD